MRLLNAMLRESAIICATARGPTLIGPRRNRYPGETSLSRRHHAQSDHHHRDRRPREGFGSAQAKDGERERYMRLAGRTCRQDASCTEHRAWKGGIRRDGRRLWPCVACRVLRISMRTKFLEVRINLRRHSGLPTAGSVMLKEKVHSSLVLTRCL